MCKSSPSRALAGWHVLRFVQLLVLSLNSYSNASFVHTPRPKNLKFCGRLPCDVSIPNDTFGVVPDLRLNDCKSTTRIFCHESREDDCFNNENPFQQGRNGLDLSKRGMVQKFVSAALVVYSSSSNPLPSNAVPPAYVIAEELGYFPVTNRAGETTYISARVKRKSTDQAIALAEYLSSKECNAVMYGAFWCPHCQRQKEMFGREAWSKINYVECDSRGEGNKASVCLAKGVNGFPTWKISKRGIGGKNDFDFSGEMPLLELAKRIGYKGSFDPDLEPNFSIGNSASCG